MRAGYLVNLSLAIGSRLRMDIDVLADGLFSAGDFDLVDTVFKLLEIEEVLVIVSDSAFDIKNVSSLANGDRRRFVERVKNRYAEFHAAGVHLPDTDLYMSSGSGYGCGVSGSESGGRNEKESNDRYGLDCLDKHNVRFFKCFK